VRVPFYDLAAAHSDLRQEIDAAIARVIDSGKFILGPELQAFEREFATFVESTHCLGAGNGLDALELAIRALGADEGDEVIVPANTFIATWIAVTRVGATVVPVEPLQDTYNIDPSAAAAAVTAKTRGIIAVHLYGQPADMTSLRNLASEHGLWLLEDAAQAHGARWAGRRAGALGDAAAWSFYPGKNLGAIGDAGAITTDRSDVADRVGQLRNYGSSSKYVHDEWGVNSRLDELQAAVLRVKLTRLDDWNDRRRRLANTYLAGLEGASVRLPAVDAAAEPVWHQFVIQSEGRDELQAALSAAGIGTLIHYPIPPHLQGAYRALSLPTGTFPLTERLHREVLSLPMGPHVTEEQTEAVIEAVWRA
jgi:dTDP-4-amino-4,6-dideoxygalactose transaminase